MRPKWIIAAPLFLATLFCNPFCERLAAQNVLPNPNTPKPSPPTISLSPAVIMLKAQPGASSAHELKITNLTYTRLPRSARSWPCFKAKPLWEAGR